MRTKKPRRFHLEIQKYKDNYYGLIRPSLIDDGNVMHTNHGRLTGMSLNELKFVQVALRGDVVFRGSAEEQQVIESKDYRALEIEIKKTGSSISTERIKRAINEMNYTEIEVEGKKVYIRTKLSEDAK